MAVRSRRYERNVWLTHHAEAAMAKRSVDAATVYDVIETGEVVERGLGHAWIYKHIPSRQDNLVCVAVVIDQALIVKTVMVEWTRLQEES